MNREFHDPIPGEEALQDMFRRTATELPDPAARRLEAAARRIPAAAPARGGLVLAWLGAATALAAATLIAVVLWRGDVPIRTDRVPSFAHLSGDVRLDAAPDTGGTITSLSLEQSEAWAATLDPFGDDEIPDLMGSLGAAPGMEDLAELELWVQAADEILAEVDEI